MPPTLQLAPTLAQRILQLREFRNMTVKDLARAARFNTRRIEDLEAGLEIWLSSTDRQLLAKALAIEPFVLQEVETRPALGTTQEQLAASQYLARAILEGARDLQCPQCGNSLRCSVQEGLDLEERPIRFPKAFCLKCPYVLK